jgi:hypothetical protein
MPSKWIEHVKNYQNENKCSYKEARSRSKYSYSKTGKTGAGFKDDLKVVTRKVKNSAKRVRKVANKASNHASENKEFINLLGGEKLQQNVDKVQNKYKKANEKLKEMETAVKEGQPEPQVGGRITKKSIARKIKNTGKAVRKVAKKMAPALALLDPEMGLALEAGLAVTGGKLANRGYKKTNMFDDIVRGGSFATPQSFGGSFSVPRYGGSVTNSTMVHPHHHSFHPLPTKPTYIKNYTN